MTTATGVIVEISVATMPLSVPPKSRRGAPCSVRSSPASSEDEGAGKSSTSSLLSPSFHQSFPRLYRKEQEESTTSASRGMSISQRSIHHSAEHIRNKKQQNQSPVADNLSPWEEWFLCKEKELRARLQAQVLEELNVQMEKKKEKQERERKKMMAEVKHKEWVQKKNEEERKAREHKLSKEMAEKAAKEFEKVKSKEKAKEMYEEWLKKKRSEEVMKKKEEKEKERQLQAELQDKKEKSEKMFKEWLETTRDKPRPASASYAYANGKLSGLFLY
ncbi:coiled-coil domain-containing protein 34 isoform X5 [Sphaerodactylus townsendi]|uniref:coiled-coil domain-containing protein 34 isoform X5 n=1 Tax=Sphaerodactylus townsendi TaxID=933632 RepID=UPI0020267ABB|nr:coiled-coil domain-containing protein 34 isoform X5 [Sphaerodactylus townsendi]